MIEGVDPVESIRIVALAIAAAVAYGIVHDQFTARICVEYFNVYHDPILQTASPTLLALGLGIAATWWMGFGLGLPLALAAQIGSRPRRDARSLVRPIASLLGVMALGAVLAGATGYLLVATGTISIRGFVGDSIPPSRYARFACDYFAHNASYAVGGFGGLVVIAYVWWERGRAGRPVPVTPVGGGSGAPHTT